MVTKQSTQATLTGIGRESLTNIVMDK